MADDKSKNPLDKIAPSKPQTSGPSLGQRVTALERIVSKYFGTEHLDHLRNIVNAENAGSADTGDAGGAAD